MVDNKGVICLVVGTGVDGAVISSSVDIDSSELSESDPLLESDSEEPSEASKQRWFGRMGP